MKVNVWVIASPYKGDLESRVAIAESIAGNDYSIIWYKSLLRWFESIGRSRWQGFVENMKYQIVTKLPLAYSKGMFPDIVITGSDYSREIDSALNLKRRSGGNVIAVCVCNPKMRLDEFDLVFIPQYDQQSDGGNVFQITGIPSRVNEMRLRSEVDLWKEKLSHLQKPISLMLIGGDIGKRSQPERYIQFTKSNALEYTRKVKNAIGESSGSVVITDSRRTPSCIKEIILSEMKGISVTYISHKSQPNPYIALLGLADRIFVTGDSISMTSDAVSTGKSVYIYMPVEKFRDEHNLHVNFLIQNGYARLLENKAESFSYKPLCTTQVIVGIILNRL